MMFPLLVFGRVGRSAICFGAMMDVRRLIRKTKPTGRVSDDVEARVPRR
jgi:hypothetical protein